MKTLSLITAAVLLVSATLPAAAQNAPAVNKTWVSSTGTDTGPCKLAAPCQTFAYALGETLAGGEIDVKDSGVYGTVTINKSVAIVAPDGVLATLNVPAYGTGIQITAQSSDTILLRGLSIDGHNAGGTGIRISNALNTTVDHCIVRNLAYGIIAATGFVLITNNVITGGYQAVADVDSANTYIGKNIITGSNFGLAGSFTSYGDNKINGNTECDTCQATLKAAPNL